jgi:3-oxoadipate enol-lactonase
MSESNASNASNASNVLTHRVSGEGEPLLLLNGGLMSIAAWDKIAAPLEGRFQVVRCDFRGQLLSPGEPEPRLEAHVADVIALLDHLDIERAHLAGVSYGALVALRLAAMHPERVLSVAAVSTADRITPRIWKETAEMREIALEAAAGGDGGRVLDFLLPRTYTAAYLESQNTAMGFYRQWVAALPVVWYRGLAALLASMQGLDLTPHLGAIRCPVLIVGAEGDRTFPPEHSRALADGIAGSRLVIEPGGSHGFIVEHSERVQEILLDFFSSLDSDPAAS